VGPTTGAGVSIVVVGPQILAWYSCNAERLQEKTPADTALWNLIHSNRQIEKIAFCGFQDFRAVHFFTTASISSLHASQYLFLQHYSPISSSPLDYARG
jgi:hypothetical protein